MGRKKLRGRGRKKSNIKLNIVKQFKEKEVPLSTAQSSTTAKESISENKLEVEPLLQTDLHTSQRKSNRTRVIGDNAYHCRICDLKFNTAYTLRRHLDYYGDPKYACKECKTKFTDKKQLQNHIQHSHGNPWLKFSMKCVVCSQMFMRMNYLQAHLSHYHEDRKVSTEAIEDTEPCRANTKSVIETESPEFVKDSASSMEDLKKMTITHHSKSELNLETECISENDTLLAESVENVTIYPATVFDKPVVNRNKKHDERSRTEDQTVPNFVESTDDLQNILESNCASQAITRENGHSSSGGEEVSHEIKDRFENERNLTLGVSEKMLCFNDEMSLLLKPEVEEGTNDTITEEHIKIDIKMENVFYSSSVIEDHTSVIENTKTITPASDKYEKPQATPITHAEHGESIVNGISPSVPISAVPNEDKDLLENVGTDVPQQQLAKQRSFSSSFRSFETNNVHDIRVAGKSPGKNVLLEASSNKDKIDASPTDFQEKDRDNTADEPHRERYDYEKETALRRLYSCKDCYVPLVRVQISESHAVIPSVICDRKFATKDMMFRHYRLMHFTYSNDQVHCVCGKRMNGDEALQFHFYRHCQKTIQSATIPTNSEATCNLLEQKFSCTGCDKNFWLESCLRSHVFDCKSFMRQKVEKILTKRAAIPTTVIAKHVCAVCCSTFRSEEKLVAHENMYSRRANHRCTFCETMFYGDRQWRCHMATAHNPIAKKGYDFECTICSERFNTRRLERMHRMHIHREASSLSLENVRGPTARNLSPHDSDDPGDNELSINKCDVCNIVFLHKKRFINHTIYFTTSETIYCKICGEKFQGQYRAHHHNKTVHYSEDTLKAYTHHCNICKEGFMYMTHLHAHMCHVHPSEAKDSNRDKNLIDTVLQYTYNACSVCDVEFSTPALLAAHHSDFSDDGEYLCNRCSKKCRTPSALLDHLTLNHSNNALQGGVKCRRCNENFLTPSACVSHVKHVHKPHEPSEFYLEKNVASTEESGDVRYELIPTNESISSGVAYFKVKNSIDFPMIAPTAYANERSDKKSSVPHASTINAVIPAEEKSVVNSVEESEKTRFNVDNRIINITNLEEEGEEVLTINISDIVSKDSDRLEVPSISNETIFGLRPKNKRCWNCLTCGYIYPGPANLAKHMSLYSDRGHHMCETCGRRFEVYAFYLGHIASHIDYEKNAYVCTSCKEGFKTSKELKMHLDHLHPNAPPQLPSGVSAKVPAHKHPASQETSREVRELPQTQDSNFNHHLPASSVKKSQTPGRTYSRQQCNQTGMVLEQGDPSSPKKVEATESPQLHTEIFEDEISMIYECPDCHEKYSSVKRLNDHLTAVHGTNQVKNELETCSKLVDAPVTCDVCDKVFANENILITHREKIHFIKSSRVVKNPVPVLEITVPNNRSNDPSNDQRSVVIGRLYKLEEMNEVPKPVDIDENSIAKKISVARIVDANDEQPKLLPKSTVKIKANAAVRLKPPVAPAIPLKPLAATAKHLTLPLTTAKRLTLPLTTGKLFQLPVATAAKLEPGSLTVVRLKSVKNALRRKQPVPIVTKQVKSVPANVAGQLKSVVANAVPLKSLVGRVVPLKSLVGKVVPLKLPAGKVVPLNLPIEKVVPLKPPVAKVVPLNLPVEKVVPLKRPVEKVVPSGTTFSTGGFSRFCNLPVEQVVTLKPPVEKVVPSGPTFSTGGFTRYSNLPVEQVVTLKPPVEKVVPLNLPVEKVVPLKPPVEKVVPLNLPIEKVVPLKPPVEKVVPLNLPVEKVVPLNLPVEKVVPLKPPVEKVVPLKLPVEKVVPLNLPVEKVVPLKPPVEKVVPLNLPVEEAVPLKPAVEKVVPLNLPVEKVVPLKPPVEKVVPLNLPVEKVVPLKPPVEKVVPLNLPVEEAVPLKPPVEKVVPLNLPVEKVVPLKPPVEKVVPLNLPVEKVVPLKPPVTKVVPLKPAVKKVVPPTPLALLNMGQMDFLEFEERKTRNFKKNLKAEEDVTPFRITSVYSENQGVSKPVNRSDPEVITRSPSTLIKPTKIIEVEPCNNFTNTITRTPESISASTAVSEMANTIDTTSDCQLTCYICNIRFIRRSQMIEHERSVHSSTSLNIRPTDKSSTEGASGNSSIDQIIQLVGTLPVQPETLCDTEDQISFSCDFESVLLPVSDDDFDHIVDDNQLEKPVHEINQKMMNRRSEPVAKELSYNDNAVLFNRPFASKRKGIRPIGTPKPKRPKGSVFDPVAYEELCRQHNLVPNTKPKPKKRK